MLKSDQISKMGSYIFVTHRQTSLVYTDTIQDKKFPKCQFTEISYFKLFLLKSKDNTREIVSVSFVLSLTSPLQYLSIVDKERNCHLLSEL